MIDGCAMDVRTYGRGRVICVWDMLMDTEALVMVVPNE